MLDLKQAMDRYVALFLFGLALVVGAGYASQSSISSDLVPPLVLAALFCAGVSFFEPP
jgi:hypothetical protein